MSKVVYIVTEFGCNSGDNDMYPPTVTAFSTYNAAYKMYRCIEKKLTPEDPGICYTHHEYDQVDDTLIRGYLIQNGGDEGFKRPKGVMFNKVVVEAPAEDKQDAAQGGSS